MLKERAYRGVIWQFFNIGFAATSSILFMVIMGRLLDPLEFGKFALVMAIIAATQTITQFGFGPALVQKQSLEDHHTTFVFGSTILLGVLSCGILWFLAPFLTQWFSGKIDSSLVRIAAFGLFISTVGITSRYLLTRELRFDRLFWVDNIAFVAGNLLLGTLLAFKGFGVHALIFGVITTNTISCILLLYLRPLTFKFNFNQSDSRYFLNYGSGLLVVQLLNQLAMQVDKLIIGSFNSLATLGSFERAQRIQSLPMTYIGNTIEGVVFALLSRLSDQREKIGKHYFPLIALISVLTMFFSAYAFFFSKEIVVLLLGAQWGDSAVILKWIAIVIFIQTFSRFSDTLVRATNEFPASAKIKFIYLISIVIFIIIGNALAGINGVLVGIILANLLHSVLMLRLGLKITSFAYKGLLWMLLRVLVLAAVVVAKGLYLAHISPNIAVQLALSMISDCLLLVIFISSPRLAGRLISEFVDNRISEIPWLSKIQLGRNL